MKRRHSASLPGRTQCSWVIGCSRHRIRARPTTSGFSTSWACGSRPLRPQRMSPANPIEARVRARLVALDRDGLLRTLRPPTGVDLSSNDYLNLATDGRVTTRFADAIAREGCGSTGSRLLRGE